MARNRPYNVAIIGLGSAGLAAARTAVGMGLRVVAVDRSKAGGDTLWSGSIPSRALIASARAASAARHAGGLGVGVGEVTIDRDRVWQRIKDVQEAISDEGANLEHFRELGVDIRQGPARLKGVHAIQVGDELIRARRIVIATGSRPRIPEVEGLAAADPLTPDTLWQLPSLPEEVLILGAGPAGVEIAQALAQLGTKVRLVHRHERILPQEDPILAGLLEERLKADGVDIVARANAVEAAQIERGTRRLTVEIEPEDPTVPESEVEELSFESAHLLVCCGRHPNFEALDIEGAGIDHGDEGILTDERSRTSARHVYAVGDVAGRGHTATASFDGAQAVRDIALAGRSARRAAGVPWALGTEPELAHAGLTFADALARFPRRRVERFERDLVLSDRGRIEADQLGRAVVVTVGGRVAGIHILGRGAGEAIGGFQREVAARTKLRRMSSRIEAFPSRSLEVSRISIDSAADYDRRLRSWLPRIPGR